jgi:hypothetical protein
MITHQIVLAALMVAQEYALAVHTPIILPPTLCLFYGLSLGVIIVAERYVVIS